MGFSWSRTTLYERLIQLQEDVADTALAAKGLDNIAGGSEGLPEGEYGSWAAFAMGLAGDDQQPPSYLEQLQAMAKRLSRADDSDLAEGFQVTLRLYEALHLAIWLCVPWESWPGEVGKAALVLRGELSLSEDEALRVHTGYGDVRRNERRARA